MIVLEDVWKVYKSGVETVALRGVSLEIESGEYVAIVGPSGSGKSTLLHIMGLLDTPTRGRVLIEGRDVSRLGESERALIRRDFIGFVFQQFNLVPHLTALENVMLPLLLKGISRRERERRARELLERVGLSERYNHYPSQLSGGQQQRVAIARALANAPPLILADEPTGNLDSKTGKEIMELLEDVSETLVVVTHDPAIARRAERVIKIKDGKIVE